MSGAVRVVLPATQLLMDHQAEKVRKLLVGLAEELVEVGIMGPVVASTAVLVTPVLLLMDLQVVNHRKLLVVLVAERA